MLDPKHLLEICQEAQRVENWVRSLPRAFAQDANYLSLAPGDTAREDELSAAQQCAEGLLQKAKAELKENSVVEDWNAGISRLLLADLVIQIRIRASLGIINADFAMLCFESWNVSFEAARRISGQIRSVHSSSRQNSLPLIEELYKRSGARLIEATKIWVSNSVENSCAEVIINGFMGLSSLEDYPVVNSAMKGIMQFVKSKMDFLTDTPRNQQLLVRIANYILDRASKHINRLINVLKDVSSDGEDKEATLVLFFIKHLIQLVHLAPKNSFDSISFINKLLEMFNAAEKSPRCVEFYFTRVSPLLSKWIDLISTSSSDSGEIKSRTFSCLHSFKSLTWCYIFLRSKHVLSLPFQGSEQMAVLDIINHVLSPELLDYVMEIDVLPHAHKILEMLTSSIASFLLEAPPDVLKRMFNYLIIKFIDSDEPKLSLFVLRCFYRFFQRCSAKCCDEFIQNFECLLERCKLHQRMKILILLASIWTVKLGDIQKTLDMITQSLSKNTNLNIDKVIQLLLSIELIAGRGACPDNLRIRISQALLSLLDLRRTSLPVKKDILGILIGLQRLFDVVPDAPFKAVISSPIVLECLSSPEISFVLVDCIYTKLLADPSNILGGNWELLVFRILNITFEMHPELCTAAFILLGVKLLSSPELIASDKVISVLMNSKFLELIPGEIKSIVLKCEKLKALKIRFLEPNLYQNQALADFPTDFTQRVCKIRYELSQLLKELNSVSQNSESYPSIMFKISKVDGILEEISQQIVNTNKE